MSATRNAVVLVMLVVILGAVNWSIYGKERHLSHGASVYLELAPVDPRSLMQGDYMALRFQLARQVMDEVRNRDNADDYVVVRLDDNGVGSFSRLDGGEPLEANELRLRYRIRAGELKLATNAFFFQEGTASQYEPAQYGQFRVNQSGDLLLVSMHDENLLRLGDRPSDSLN